MLAQLAGLRAAGLIGMSCLLCQPNAATADGFDDALRLCPDDKVTCVSSYDATPGRFVEPWEYECTREDAVLAVTDAAKRFGGLLSRDDSSERGTALRVRFGSDETIFWFPQDDFLVNFRSEHRRVSVGWRGQQDSHRSYAQGSRLCAGADGSQSLLPAWRATH